MREGEGSRSDQDGGGASLPNPEVGAYHLWGQGNLDSETTAQRINPGTGTGTGTGTGEKLGSGWIGCARERGTCVLMSRQNQQSGYMYGSRVMERLETA